MNEEDDRVIKRLDIVIGADLSMISVEELEERIVLLQGEIERLRADIAGKQSSLSAAESLFKQ